MQTNEFVNSCWKTWLSCSSTKIKTRDISPRSCASSWKHTTRLWSTSSSSSIRDRSPNTWKFSVTCELTRDCALNLQHQINKKKRLNSIWNYHMITSVSCNVLQHIFTFIKTNWVENFEIIQSENGVTMAVLSQSEAKLIANFTHKRMSSKRDIQQIISDSFLHIREKSEYESLWTFFGCFMQLFLPCDRSKQRLTAIDFGIPSKFFLLFLNSYVVLLQSFGIAVAASCMHDYELSLGNDKLLSLIFF